MQLMYFMCLVPPVYSSQGVNCRLLWPHAHSIGPKMLPYLLGIAYLPPSVSTPYACDVKDKSPDTRKKNGQKGASLAHCFWHQKGVGSQQGNDCPRHNLLRSLGTAPSTDIKCPITVLKVFDIVLTQVRQEQSALSPKGTALLLMENMSCLCVYCLLREKKSTKHIQNNCIQR